MTNNKYDKYYENGMKRIAKGSGDIYSTVYNNGSRLTEQYKGYYQIATNPNDGPIHFRTPESNGEWVEVRPIIEKAINQLKEAQSGIINKEEIDKSVSELERLNKLLLIGEGK